MTEEAARLESRIEEAAREKKRGYGTFSDSMLLCVVYHGVRIYVWDDDHGCLTGCVVRV